MWPYFHIEGIPYPFHWGTLLMYLSIALCAWMAIRELSPKFKWYHALSLVLGISVIAFFGARLFHLVVERPQFFLNHPSKALSSFDGMTFYGAFLSGAFGLWLVSLYISDESKQKLFDLAALSTALTYGFMRLGCFLSGCCWGKITPVKWGVVYHHPKSFMPYHGIPVHPVQIYDALLGFGLFFLLLFLRQKKPQVTGKLFPIFILFYAIGRFFTETFRGDSYRGVDILLGLSTSQVISVGLFFFVIFKHGRYMLKPLLKPLFATLIITLVGCLPKPPSESVLKPIGFGSPSGARFYKIDRKGDLGVHRRNLLYVAVDNTVAPQFKDLLEEAYDRKPAPRIEDISWWKLIKSVRKLYHKVAFIPHNRFNFQSFKEALQWLETQARDYDVYLLTHGWPNHITASEGEGLISYEQIQSLSNVVSDKWKFAYMQGCYSNTLAADIHDLGVQDVFSFDGLNRNFFFVDFFMQNYIEYPYDVEAAHRATEQSIYEDMEDSKLYSRILEAMDISLNEYFSNSPAPFHSRRN